MKGVEFMLLSSGGDGGNNNKLLFLLLSMVLFLSLFISPVYAEETTNPYVPYEITNFKYDVDSNSELATITFNYKEKTYSLTENIFYTHYIKQGGNIVFLDYPEGSSNKTLNICLTTKLCNYTLSGDILNIQSMYLIPLNLETSEFKIIDSGSLGTSHKKNISYTNASLNGEYFVYANFDVPKVGGGYFFQLPPPPPPTILEGVSLEGVLIQVIYLLPSCLLWIVSYLALRKCIMPLLALLKT